MIKNLFAGLFFALTTALAAEPHLQWQPLNEPGCGGWLTSIAINPKDSSKVLVGGDMLGIGVSQNGGEKWESTFGTLSYEIANITYNPKNPQIVWVATMSGPQVSRDGGIHWEPKRNGLPAASDNSYRTPIQQIFIDPVNDQRLLAFGGSWRGWVSNGETQFGWIWESLDGGESWHEFSTLKRYRNIKWVALAAGGFNTFYANVVGKGLYKSEDGAKTWAEITGLPSKNVNQIATHPTNPNILWVSLGNSKDAKDTKGTDFQPGGVWKSSDAGKTWIAANQGLPQEKSKDANLSSRFSPLTVSQSNPNVLYTSDGAYNNPAIYRTEDGGANWKPIFTNATRNNIGTAYPAGIGATVITVDPENADIVYAAGSETIIKSGDGGKTWVDQTSIKVANTDPASKEIRWQGRGYSGLCTLVVRFNPKNPNVTALVSMDAGRLWLSEDQEKTWIYPSQGFRWSWGGGRDVAFAGPEGKTVLGAFGQHGYSGDVGLSEDGGHTWKMLGKPGSGLPESGKGEVSSCYLLPDNPDKMWVVYSGKLYSSTDRGQKWNLLIDKGCNRIFSEPSNSGTFYVTGSFGVQKTTDGNTFTPILGSPEPSYAGVIDQQNPSTIYVTQNHNKGGCVWKYDGTAWSKVLDNPLVSGLAIDPTDGNRIIASTNRDPFKDVCDATGAWISEDGGITWSNQKEGLSCLRGWDVAINPHDPEKVYFCSLGRGFFTARWPKKAK